MPGRSVKELRRARRRSAASSMNRLLPRHSSREGAATKGHRRQPSWLAKKSTAGSIAPCLSRNGKDGNASLRRVRESFAIYEAICPNRRSEYIACITMRWPRFFDDPTYRNPSIWTWREWLTVFALGIATIAIAAVLFWPIAKLLMGL
jgi:hypothetical protein